MSTSFSAAVPSERRGGIEASPSLRRRRRSSIYAGSESRRNNAAATTELQRSPLQGNRKCARVGRCRCAEREQIAPVIRDSGRNARITIGG